MSYNRPPPQPPSGYHPQGHTPYPPNSGYGGPPPGPLPPGGYHPPPGPPPGHYQAYHPQGPGGPPPHSPGPQGGYSQGPPQGFAPPPGPPPGHFPPPGSPMRPPPGAFGGPPHIGPPGPSFGYIPGQMAQGDFRAQADALRKAMKGFGSDKVALVHILSRLDPLQMAAVRETYSRHIGRDLYKDVKSETSGHFEQGLLAIIEGPLNNDAELVRDAVKGLGTKEWLLNDVLVGRSNADLREIKNAYQHRFSRNLEKDVEDDLSAQTKILFARIISATRNEESTPYNQAAIEKTARDIHVTTEERMVNDVAGVCAIFAHSSDNELRAINHAFQQKYNMDLEKLISKQFSGHMKAALLCMLQTATDPARRDADALEECMAGPGTKDFKLVTRIVRLHWNKDHLDQVRKAYQHHYHRDLLDRVRGETSGDYQRLMVALLS